MAEVVKILSRDALDLIPHTPAGATAEVIKYVSMRDFDGFCVGYTRTAGTDVLTALSIFVGDAASPSTSIVVKAHALGTDVDAVGDQVYLEVNAQEVQKAANDAGITFTELFVSAVVTEVGVGDTSVVLQNRSYAHHKVAGLTSDVIA